MKVKIFDESHEKDLEEKINNFIKEHTNIIDIKYQVSIGIFSEEQVYCFSAMILYKWGKNEKEFFYARGYGRDDSDYNN